MLKRKVMRTRYKGIVKDIEWSVTEQTDHVSLQHFCRLVSLFWSKSVEKLTELQKCRLNFIL